ncbi:Cytochrome b561 [Mariprofundus ferrinatatus]|uniref:Cytochrome b561 n=1 Tax=Mariprofundus ferrinatatus TaxID=1921087 RepID=A0A2K8L5R0_9PROT|nr:cytochrome b/b6 domain-containing protein [Mariprofundus ferrinatatus]ATX81579.1 Cytochrome b561 [Mariprofundus ferrinatatus]
MKYEKSTRILHILLMLTVLAQLLSEQFMQVPKPGKAIDQLAGFIFSIHQFGGFVVLIVAIAYLMTVLDRDESRLRLFPWLDPAKRKSLITEIKCDIPGWFKGVLPPPEQAHLIAGTVHGLGLMLATGLGLTGSIIYLGMKHDGGMPPAVHTIKELHELLGTTLWFFVVGHLLMALLHQIKGHRVLQKMFTANDEQ